MIAIPRVLSIAGTDPTGGAGIQADLKSISANGGYGMAVVTALVAQNTIGVRSVHRPPVSFLREQLDAVSDDVVIDAVKIGMLGSVAVITEVADWLALNRPAVVVLDPVMVATSGDRLLDDGAEAAMLKLLANVDIVTPNLPELGVLAGKPPATTWPSALAHAREVSARHRVIVLVKGGHLDGVESPDALVDASGRLPGGVEVIEVGGRRVDTVNTHGTGCSLSSALATLQPRFDDWERSLRVAKSWLTSSIEHSDELGVGSGHGPVHHFARLWSGHALEPAVTPCVTWWGEIADIRGAIDELEFVVALGDGTLTESAFSFYLAQDALYLLGYSRALARASQLAPTRSEQAFWAQGAHDSIVGEMELHRTFLKGRDTIKVTAPVTRAYLDHLAAASAGGSYGELVAAVLPCFWIYQDVGERLSALNHDDHPYTAWLSTYGQPAFAESTATAIAIVDRAALTAHAGEREAMRNTFRISAEHELAFFEMGSGL